MSTPDPHAIVLLVEAEDGDITVGDGVPVVGGLSARDERWRESRWLAARDRHRAAMAALRRLPHNAPVRARMAGELEARRAAAALAGEEAIAERRAGFVFDAEPDGGGDVPWHLQGVYAMRRGGPAT